MKKKLLTLVCFLLSVICMHAEVEHVVERGETLESIAKQYNVTPQSIIAVNPQVADMFFAGIVLIIPQGDTNTLQSVGDAVNSNPSYTISSGNSSENKILYSANNSVKAEIANNDEEVTIEDFSNWFVTYCARFDAFGQGRYGLGWNSFNKSGFGFTMSILGSWGLTKPGILMYEFGPSYGYAFNKYLAGSASLRGIVDGGSYDYLSFNSSGRPVKKSKYKVSGGITVTPQLLIRLNKFIVGVGYELGWHHGSKALYHDFQFTFGYNF